MNTVQELTEYGFSEYTVRLMLDSYEKHIGEVHGCNKVTDITYIGNGNRDVELTCTLCGAVNHKVFAHGTAKWGEIRKTCSCQMQPKETLPKLGVVRNDDPSYIGKVYGDFEVVDTFKVPHSSKSGNTIMWMCRCIHCGEVFKKQPSEIKRGKKCKCQIEAERKAIWDAEIGRKYGRLTVIGIEHKLSGKYRTAYAVCGCDCGSNVIVQVSALRSGATKSCGCLEEEYLKKSRGSRNESRTKSPLYGTWSGMRQRCFNKNSHAYKNYGGRGITICPDWLGPEGFDRFEKWAYENGYEPEVGLSLDRIDVNGNYEPNNCRWANIYIQAVNKRPRQPAKRKPVKTYTIDGEEKTLNQWCREYHISTNAVYYRTRKLGMSLEQALKTPKSRKGNVFAGKQAKERVKDINKCNSYIEANLYLAAARNNISVIPQYSVGKYRADFLVEDTNFLVECDGFDHHRTVEQIKSDNERERFFMKQGYVVIRFSGTEINNDPDACCQEIMDIVRANHEQPRQTNVG